MDPPTVDSTYERNITDDDLPLITICPEYQIDFKRLKELHYDNLLHGWTRCNETTECYSWGDNLNLTFDGLTRQTIDLKKMKNMKIWGGEFKEKFVFIPKYGLCKETSSLNVSQELELHHFYPGIARVLITDKSYRSYFMPDLSSHSGSKLYMESYFDHYFDVKIQVRDSCLNKETPMAQYEFQTCVDNKIQTDFAEYNVECVPPWLSFKKQCNSTYPKNLYGNFRIKWTRNYLHIFDVLDLSNINHEEYCKESCREVTYIVKRKGIYKTSYAGSAAYITFNKKVVVTGKVPNYSMFQYIIDVGSSLGLWLGLSVFGLHDLVVDTVQFIKNRFIMKKIRSAVSK